ncbi:MAG: acyltransferase domain-containing protein [Actinobacteria bacterium]|nr:acyltransferase domain-containing protein [Actinomycetota bacterium]
MGSSPTPGTTTVMTMSPVRDNHVVALFPGQGSLVPGVGRPWASDKSWNVIHELSEVTNVDIAHLLLTAEHDEVVQTDNAQIATYALSLVGWDSYQRRMSSPAVFLGHSLGEFTALAAAGVIDYVSGAKLVQARGRAMKHANDVAPGTMAALMGGDDGAIARLGEIDDLWLANFNGEGQTVVSGSLDAITELERRGKEMGWRRVTRLKVGGAFHSPLMRPAQTELDNVLATTTFHPTDASVLANVDGSTHNGGDVWRTLLSRQLTEPVQFMSAVLSLSSDVTHSLEMPPGAILTGLTKRIRIFREQSCVEPIEEQL